jgi:integrase
LSDGGRLYVSCQAVAILRDLYSLTGPESYVFPSRKAGLPMSHGTINAALRTIGYSGHEMTGHGFRATGRTLTLERLGYDKEVIERHLAHGSDEELGDAYDRAQFFDQRRRMSQTGPTTWTGWHRKKAQANSYRCPYRAGKRT